MPRLKYIIPEYKRKYIRKRRAKDWKEVPANRAAVRAHRRATRLHGSGITRAMRKGRDEQPSWTQPVIEEPEWGSVKTQTDEKPASATEPTATTSPAAIADEKGGTE